MIGFPSSWSYDDLEVVTGCHGFDLARLTWRTADRSDMDDFLPLLTGNLAQSSGSWYWAGLRVL